MPTKLSQQLFALVVGLVAIASSTPAFAQEQKPPLRWGMDATGGAPYVFDNETRGFEVELAEYIARELGRTSKPFNAPGSWDKLPDLLENKQIDLVLNGYEYSEQFQKQASRPYYIYKLAMVVRANDESIRTWDDLRVKPGAVKKRVGVLRDSAADRYMTRVFGDTIDLQKFADVANTFNLVETSRLDATVQDNPAAGYFLAEDASKQKLLRGLDEMREEGFYVALTRAEDVELRKQIDAAIEKAIDDGSLEKIYRKYSIWNADQERLGYWRASRFGETAEHHEHIRPPLDWNIAIRMLLYAAGMTFFLAVTAMPLAMAAGLVIASVRVFAARWLGYLFAAHVELIRGTPLLLQLWVLFYLLPKFAPAFRIQELPPALIGILGLAINYSASLAEHFRGAFLNLPVGQREAALALGLSPWATIRRVLAPQAIRAAIPSTTNDFVALFKDTAVCSVIAVLELTQQYNTLYNNYREHVLSFAAITAVLYMSMSYPLSLVARRLERKAH